MPAAASLQIVRNVHVEQALLQLLAKLVQQA